jgi:Fur family transcriptional regulator, ferric uptake regulator
MIGIIARLFAREAVLSEAGPADACALAALHAASFHRGWREDEFERLLLDRNVVAHRATVRGILVGFILSRLVLDEAEILSVAVASARKRAGATAARYQPTSVGCARHALCISGGGRGQCAGAAALSRRGLPRRRAPGIVLFHDPRFRRRYSAPRPGVTSDWRRNHMGCISVPNDVAWTQWIPARRRDIAVGRRSVVNAPKPRDIEALCSAKGMRMTEQRRVIARVLAAADDHPDVEELYRRCSAVDDRISISTVYRTVKLFEDAGIIERHDFRNGRARYEQMPDSHHDHLINLRTGEVIEFQSEDIERLQADVARRLGYRLVDHRLELYAVPLDDKPKR